MLRHIVLFRRKSNIDSDPSLEATLVARMKALGTQIPAIRQWHIAANEVTRAVSWHYVLESAVDDVPALDEYLYHPLHQALIADLKPYFEWASVDFTDR